MKRSIYIGHDDVGNVAIAAYDAEQDKFYGTKWHGSIRYIGYSKREAERKFRQDFNLQGVHFTRIKTGFMW